MQDAGPALIGLGRGTGEHRATDAARQAIASPLLEASIEGARGILFNVSGPPDLRLREVRGAAEAIRERADPDANVIFGASFSDSLDGDVLVTLIATGLATPVRTEARPADVRRGCGAARTAHPPAEHRRAEDPPAVPPTPAIPVMAAPKTSGSDGHDAAPREVAPAPTQHIQPRSAGGPELPEQVQARSTSAESDDLDVPSFLRRGGRPASQA